MNAFGTVVLLSGFALLIAAQLYVTVMAFKVAFLKGLICLVIPGYVFWVAKRNGFYGKFLTAYAMGILALVIGGSILS